MLVNNQIASSINHKGETLEYTKLKKEEIREKTLLGYHKALTLKLYQKEVRFQEITLPNR